MHLTDEQIQRLADEQLPESDRRVLDPHLAPCAECRDRLAAARFQSEEILNRLRTVDHPVPEISAEMVIRRAHQRRPNYGRWAAAVLLSFGLAGVAYAAPGSPLPGWIKTISTWIGSESGVERVPTPVGPVPAPAPVRAGIAVVPGERLVILFQLGAHIGSARVILTDGNEVVVRAGSGDAGFTAGEDQLVIEGRGDSSSFELQVPRSAPRVEILVHGRSVFLKVGDHISAAQASSTDGSYLLPLSP